MSQANTERNQNNFRFNPNPLETLFFPRNVAVIGASERQGSIGRTLLWNLTSNPFGGSVFPVNPKYEQLMDMPCYATIADVPEPVDLVVIATPPRIVPDIVQQCVAENIPGAIIVSSGFKESGAEGTALETEILRISQQGGMRIIGPNCLGVMNMTSGLNATFATDMARPGTVGFISQSGALGTAILDWSFRENVGFSTFVSVGSMLDVDWADLIYYLGDDPKTKSIVIYMETIGNARAFLSAAREVALAKPIIVLKPGRTEEAAQAAMRHTGSQTGEEAVLAAAFRRCGVLRVNTIGELFNMAEILAKQPRPRGPRLTIVSNAGGPGVLAADALVGAGGKLTPLTDETIAALDEVLPPAWSHANPIDILGDADADRYETAVQIAANDANSDGVLVLLTPQAMTQPTRTAQRIKAVYERPPRYSYGKPVLACWMGDANVSAGTAILNQANIPTYSFPDTAVQAFSYMWRFQRRLNSLYETPHLTVRDVEDNRVETAVSRVNQARENGRSMLTEYESKQLLAAYGIPVVKTRLAKTPDEAVAQADAIGYPVVVKLNSSTLPNKSAVGGVRLDLATPDEVSHAFRMIRQRVNKQHTPHDFSGVTVQPMMKVHAGYQLRLSACPDAQFGPVIQFGVGGEWTDVYQDWSLGLPPLTTTLARRIMEKTQIFQALARETDFAAHLDMLDMILVRFAEMMVTQPWVREMVVDPLFISAEGVFALDARVMLYGKEMSEADLPRLAIRPFPTEYVQPFETRKGDVLTIRPIRAEDEPLVVAFHKTLSERSVYLRYFRSFNLEQRTSHERLVRICHVDYDREIVLVAEKRDPETAVSIIWGIGRLTKARTNSTAEFALLISDDFQGHGLGTELLRRLLDVGRHEGVTVVEAYILAENRGMLAVCEKLGFSFSREGETVKAVIDLTDET